MITLKKILRSEVRPALGCTEPVCVALTCAHATSLILDKEIEKIEIILSPGLYKNGMGVFLPGVDGEKGLYMAASLGAIAGDPNKDLEVLSNISKEDILRARELIDNGKIFISVDYKKTGIFVSAKIYGTKDVAQATISGLHNQLVELKLNDTDVLIEKREKNNTNTSEDITEIVNWIKNISCDELFELLDELDLEDYEFLKQGVDMNLSLAREGLKKRWGYSVGRSFSFSKPYMEEQMEEEIKKWVISAVDARMGGCPLPAMSSAGSGNNGIVATIPSWVVYSKMGLKEEDFLRSVALSHLFTSKLKAHIGRVTPVCSCGLSAGGGVAGSISYLLTGDKNISKEAVKNHLVSLYGILCDGAKPACSIKIYIALSSALTSISLAKDGISISREDGICGKDLDETLSFIESLSSRAYVKMDRNILDIMTKK